MSNSKNVKSLLTRITVMFLFLVNTETSLVNSALGEITKAFPNVDTTLISLISTAPIFAMFIMSLAAGALANRFNKKSLVLVALILYIIGGVGGFFLCNSIFQIIFCRVILGIGSGIAAPLCGMIIAELYESDTDRTNMFGLTQGVSSLIAAGVTVVGGALMLIRWNYVFLAYAIFIVVILLAAWRLPSMPPMHSQVDTSKAEKPKYNKKQKIKTILIVGYTFCNLLGGMLAMLKFSIYISEYNLGSTLLSSSAMSVYTVCMTIGGFIFWIYQKIFKRYTLILAPISAIAGYLIFIFTRSAAGVYAAMLIIGLGSSALVPAVQVKAISIGSKNHAAYAMSAVFVGLYLGQICATFVQKFLGFFGNPSTISTFIFGASFLGIITLVYIIYTLVVPEQKNGNDNEFSTKQAG